MKLLTEEIKLVLPKIYQTDAIPLSERLVICKFFTPWSFWTWFVFEGEPEKHLFEDRNTDDYIFYGMVHGFERELGYFRLSELTSIRGPNELRVERDFGYFKIRYSSCCWLE